MMVLLESLPVWYLVVLHLALQLIVTASLRMIDSSWIPVCCNHLVQVKVTLNILSVSSDLDPAGISG